MAGRDQGPIRTVAMAGSLGFTLAFSIILGALAGHYLDQRWGTSPWLTVLGLFVGTGAGFYEIFTLIRQYSTEELAPSEPDRSESSKADED